MSEDNKLQNHDIRINNELSLVQAQNPPTKNKDKNITECSKRTLFIIISLIVIILIILLITVLLLINKKDQLKKEIKEIDDNLATCKEHIIGCNNGN